MIIIYNNIEIVVFPGWPSIWYGGERWEGGAKKRGRGQAGVHGETFPEQETFHPRQLQTTLVRFDEALSRLLRRRWRGEYSPSLFAISTPSHFIRSLFLFFFPLPPPLPDCSLLRGKSWFHQWYFQEKAVFLFVNKPIIEAGRRKNFLLSIDQAG